MYATASAVITKANVKGGDEEEDDDDEREREKKKKFLVSKEEEREWNRSCPVLVTYVCRRLF